MGGKVGGRRVAMGLSVVNRSLVVERDCDCLVLGT